ncbi:MULTISPECIES: DUF3073 domain-containing protein [Streptomyces]|uniref:DUF3073 domain-containing protein n=1 Tax=Streptomyces morookaense TaxID=1970 RepID=A0A7Y7BBI8_STRMO|nr:MULTISPECIES: DUF3073 domain-containing protein [Streptomyces]MCC2275171.1 DUF3073 domain-containing protein [Streptomyces sp. ET3-23]NVK82450.1 DUF3073 domain-containing protein [Streptomyces morookaense]GHF25393.1 hypothetical protein GCM10010359_29250 [Streptomyces morookaense]
MGRGRAKAKQTKVARQLKYNSGGTDLSRLANELGATQPSKQPPQSEPLEDELDDDPYAQYAARYNDEEDEDEHSASSDQSVYRRRA